jgi:hypothetical protein
VLRASDPATEAFEHVDFDGVGRDQVNGMNGPPLADAVDATDSLFEARRIPRKLDVHHETGPLLQIEAFAGGVGGEENSRIAVVERFQCGAPLGTRETSMKNCAAPR